MKILIYVLLFTIISIATENTFIKDIETEVYKIKDFNKYQDAPAIPTQEFIGIGSIEFLGWSKHDYLAYLVEDSIKTIMGDGAYADLIIYDTINNKVVYSKQIEYPDEDSKSENYPTFNKIYHKYKKEITKILDQYSIIYKKNLYMKSIPFKTSENKNITFYLKGFFKKTHPIGFGKHNKYLHKINLYSKVDNKISLCKEEIMDDGNYPTILNAKVIGVLPSLQQKVSAVIIAYVHTNGAEGNSVDMRLITCHLSKERSIEINNKIYNSLYDFCKKTGYKESNIRKLNPWINKKSTNIPLNAIIKLPTIKKEI